MKSSKRGKNISRPNVTNISEHGFWIFLNNGEYFLSFEQFPWFRDASINQITNVELWHGNHLYWPDLDVDISTHIIEHPERYKLIAK